MDGLRARTELSSHWHWHDVRCALDSRVRRVILPTRRTGQFRPQRRSGCTHTCKSTLPIKDPLSQPGTPWNVPRNSDSSPTFQSPGRPHLSAGRSQIPTGVTASTCPKLEGAFERGCSIRRGFFPASPPSTHTSTSSKTAYPSSQTHDDPNPNTDPTLIQKSSISLATTRSPAWVGQADHDDTQHRDPDY